MRSAVIVTQCKHPRYTHRVRFPRAGKRADAFFTNETEALDFAAKTRKEIGESGSAFGALSEDERSAVAFWRDFLAGTPEAPPGSMISVLRDHADRWKASRTSATVRKAVDAYEVSKTAEGLRPMSVQGIRTRCGRFAKDFGNRPICTITTAEISDWVLGLKSLNGRGSGEVGLVAKSGYRTTLSGLFTFAKSRGWVTTNPVTDSARPKPPKKRPGILPPADVATLMAAVGQEAPRLVAFWALRFFAGIREQEVLRMDWSMVDLKAGEIHLPDTVTKTGRDRTVQILPVLDAFLRPIAQPSGALAPKSEMVRRGGLAKAVKVIKREGGALKLPANAARHCFATYHLLAFRHAGETSLQLGHGGDPSMLHRHYKGLSNANDANTYWAIRPEKAENVISIGGNKRTA